LLKMCELRVPSILPENCAENAEDGEQTEREEPGASFVRMRITEDDCVGNALYGKKRSEGHKERISRRFPESQEEGHRHQGCGDNEAEQKQVKHWVGERADRTHWLSQIKP
jgi:hypothetical protein